MRYAMVAVLAGLGVAMAAPVAAQELKVGGQIRPRTEMRDASGSSDALTSMRTRVDLSARLAPRLRAFVQLQDVRIWGQEASTLSGGDQIDLHQGYLDVGPEADGVSARVGRQEVSYGEERLMGAADWVQQARALDGVRLRGRTGALTADVFGFQLADAGAPGKSADERFLGAYSTLAAGPAGAVDLYLLHDRAGGAEPTRQSTLGARWAGARGALSYRAEGALQTGTRTGADVRAYMATARIGAALAGGKAQVALWYDHLSGDADSTDATTRVFDTVLATNHRFYGSADLFTNIPVHTGGRGLRDVALRTSYAPREELSLGLDVHAFRAAAARGQGSGRFGEEADLSATYRYSPRFAVTGGVSGVVAGPALKALGTVRRNQTFSYLMLNATF
ncbi:MAG TPA: alginate export family protein [Longimicrobiales bacterium]|nr:alginate export family protein [Longimicrobiales bacterium]